MKWLFALLLIVLVRDLNGQYANSPLKPWFESQKNQHGISCCDLADGKRLEDADWKVDNEGKYWVKVDDKWRLVPDDAVIEPKDRPVDYAVVWIYHDNIYCFMAGAGS